MSSLREKVEREREGEGPSEDSPGCLGCMRIEVASVILFDGVTRVCDQCPEYLRQMRGE